MTNIFNLFLFLFLIWIASLFFVAKLSFYHLVFGVLASILVSFVAFKLKIVDKSSQMLYLHLNFYRHFLKIIIFGLFSSIKLVFSLLFIKKDFSPLIYHVRIEDIENIDQNILIATINLAPGLSLIASQKDIYTIHAIGEEYFENFNLGKIVRQIPQINENDIV